MTDTLDQIIALNVQRQLAAFRLEDAMRTEALEAVLEAAKAFLASTEETREERAAGLTRAIQMAEGKL